MAKSKTSSKSKGYRSYAAKKPYLSKKELIGIIAIAVVLIAGFIVAITVNFDGALKVVDGTFDTNGENWLIVNGSATTTPRYYKIGTLNGAPEGWTMEASTMSGTPIPTYSLTAGEGAGSVRVAISASAREHADAANTTLSYYAALSGYSEGVELSEVQTDAIAGRSVSCFTMRYTPAANKDEAEAETGDAQAEEAAEGETAGEEAETPQYSCEMDSFVENGKYSVTVFASATAEDAESLPTDEQLREYIETIIGYITFDK